MPSTTPGRSQDLRWASHVWRRGTVPIWWGVELRSGGMGEASIIVANKNTYHGTTRCPTSLTSATWMHDPCRPQGF